VESDSEALLARLRSTEEHCREYYGLLEYFSHELSRHILELRLATGLLLKRDIDITRMPHFSVALLEMERALENLRARALAVRGNSVLPWGPESNVDLLGLAHRLFDKFAVLASIRKVTLELETPSDSHYGQYTVRGRM
jgi:hypothetical protein